MTQQIENMSDELQRWQPIETAPKDGTEIFAWRGGPLLVRWISPIEFLTDRELEKLNLSPTSAEQAGWFYADFTEGGRLEGSDIPTHWMPLPKGPNET